MGGTATPSDGTEAPAHRATPADALAAARRLYLTGQRIDMQALAAELGISRPTLYRWTGGRESLLCEVLFVLSDTQFLQARRETAHLRGPDRLVAHFRLYVGRLVVTEPLQAFLRQEPHAALRILTSRESSLQKRTVGRLAEFYRDEARSGDFTPRVDIDTLAYAVVKITEAFIYNDAILAVEPEVERAAEVVAVLLGATAEPG